MEYKFEIRETLSRVVSVDAENIYEGMEKIKSDYKTEKIVLTADDYKETFFTPIPEAEKLQQYNKIFYGNENIEDEYQMDR